MTARPLLTTWLALVGLLGAELVLAWAGIGWGAPVLGLIMAAIVAMVGLRLPRASALSKIFATAGLFWLFVLLGLGSLDPLTRHDVPAQVNSRLP